MLNNHATAQTEVALLVVDHTKLAGSDTLNGLMRMNAVHIPDSGNCSFAELRRMAYLESDLFFIVKLTPEVSCDEIEPL